MGGSSVSRGKCYDPEIQAITGQIFPAGKKAGTGEKIKNTGAISILPGIYDITIWPFDFPGLAQTIKQIKISAGKTVRKELKFRWPYIEKTFKRGNTQITALKRRQPAGYGQLRLTATVNGVAKSLTAEVSANKLNSRGDETTSVYQYHSFRQGGKPGLPLPLSISIPSGDYHVYVRPYGKHLSFRKKLVPIEMQGGQTVNQNFDFPAGRLTISARDKEGIPVDARVQMTSQDGAGMLANSENHLPLDVEISPGTYRLKIFYPNGTRYGTGVEILAGKTLGTPIPFSLDTLPNTGISRITGRTGKEKLPLRYILDRINAPGAPPHWFNPEAQTPVDIPLMAGTYKVTLRPAGSGKERQVFNINIRTGKLIKRMFSLEAAK